MVRRRLSTVPPFLQRLHRQEQTKDNDRGIEHQCGQVKNTVDKGGEAVEQRELFHDARKQSLEFVRNDEVSRQGQPHESSADPQCNRVVSGQHFYNKADQHCDDAQIKGTAIAGGGNLLGKGNAVIIKQKQHDGDACRKSLIVGQGGRK